MCIEQCGELCRFHEDITMYVEFCRLFALHSIVICILYEIVILCRNEYQTVFKNVFEES